MAEETPKTEDSGVVDLENVEMKMPEEDFLGGAPVVKDTKSRAGWKWLVVIVLLLVLIGGGAFWLFTNTNLPGNLNLFGSSDESLDTTSPSGAENEPDNLPDFIRIGDEAATPPPPPPPPPRQTPPPPTSTSTATSTEEATSTESTETQESSSDTEETDTATSTDS